MTRGDQIYVMRPFAGLQGVYEHHGIDCGDGTVIHYRKTEEAAVTRTSLAAFAAGNPIYKKHQTLAFIPEDVVRRAESRLGERQYNLVSNNCEHFANWCKTGRNESEQVARFGLGLEQLSPSAAQSLIQEALQTAEPQRTEALYSQAVSNIAIARLSLETQYATAQSEMQSWHRVAQFTLQQGKEHLARAALTRKVKYKKQAAALKAQLDQLAAVENNLQQHRDRLSPHPSR